MKFKTVYVQHDEASNNVKYMKYVQKEDST